MRLINHKNDLLPGSRRQRLQSVQRCIAGSFGNLADGDHRDEESPFFDCWDWKHEQSDVLQRVDPWAQKRTDVCTQVWKIASQ